MARVTFLRSASESWVSRLLQEYRFQKSSPGILSRAAFGESIRHLNIFTVFSKEAREKERTRLKDELNRGYFDDFKDLKKTGGKVALASQNLVPVLAAGQFPQLSTYTTSGEIVVIPLEDQGMSSSSKHDVGAKRATLVCLAFRASAQGMIESWAQPFSDNCSPSSSVELIQVSFVDSWVLSLPGIKNILLRTMRSPVLKNEKQSSRKLLYSFGDTYFLRKELGIPNILAGYVFLVDKKGRVRWRASGFATSEELSSMAACTLRLLDEN